MSRDCGSVTVGDEVLLGEVEGVGVLDAFGVFAEDIDLDVERRAGDERAEAGGRVGVGNDGHFDPVARDGSHGEADAFDGDGAFFDDVAGEGVGKGETQAPVGRLGRGGVDGVEGDEGACAIDVSLHDVSAERRAGGGGQLEVDDGSGLEAGERGAGDGLGGEIGGEARREGVGLDGKRGETDAADGDAVAGGEPGGQCGRGDGDARRARSGRDGQDGPGGFDDAGEHEYRVQGARPKIPSEPVQKPLWDAVF